MTPSFLSILLKQLRQSLDLVGKALRKILSRTQRADVGDSVLGWRAHLGAGAIISNLKSDKSDVKMCFGTEKIDTYRRKCGAAVGDEAEIGCNAVLCPGTVIGKRATVYPLSRVRGYVPESSIFKGDGGIVKREVRG